MKTKIKNILAALMLLFPLIAAGISGAVKADTNYPDEVGVRILKKATFVSESNRSRSLEEGDPMPGIKFKQIDATEEYRDLIADGNEPEEAVASLQTKYTDATEEEGDIIKTTDDDGYADFGKLETRDEVGYKVYIFAEVDSPDYVVAPSVPLVLVLPTELEDLEMVGEDRYLTLNAKNVIEQDNKKTILSDNEVVVSGPNGDLTGLNAYFGKQFNYTITALVPTNLDQTESFTIEDNPDVGLAFTANDTLTISDLDESSYNLVQAADENGFTINFNLAESGTEYADDLKAMAGKYITVSYSLTVTDAAPLDTLLDNKFSLIVNNNPIVNNRPQEGPQPIVGGALFVKLDSLTNNKTLEGAEFILYDNVAGKYISDVSADGIFTWDDNRESAHVFKTDDEGELLVKGLAYSKTTDKEGVVTTHHDYQLIETKAPNGYSIVGDGITDFDVAIGTSTNALQIFNKPEGNLPSTGGNGIMLIVGLGLLILGAGVVTFKKIKA